MTGSLPQRCPIVLLYLNWLAFLGVAAYLALERQPVFLAVWIVVAPPALYGYIRVFPRISRLLGYGSVTDREAVDPARAAARVTLYTGAGCPFCPIMEQRLRALQVTMGFELEVIEVTRRPGLVGRKRIGSVPLIEVDGRRRAGCLTSRDVAVLIAGDAGDSQATLGVAAEEDR